MFILAQICGMVALILVVMSVQFKTKEKIVMCNILANIIVAIQYVLLGRLNGGTYTGIVISILNAIRCCVFYLYKKKDMKPTVSILIIFEIIAIISGIISWENIKSLMPIIVTLIATYGLWQDNVTIMRITSVIAGIGWTI